MKRILIALVFVEYLSFCKSAPLPPLLEGNTDPLLIPDIEKLRKLDELMGKAEEAAMLRLPLDVDDLLPEIEEGLIHHDAVELVDDDPELVGVAEDLRQGHAPDEFSVVALPYKFSRYDLDGDGYVTALELADATGTSLEDSVLPFARADKNDDGLLTRKELHHAPWVFDLQRENTKL